MTKVMDSQKTGAFDEMSDRDKEIQASVWALIFLIAEMALSFRNLRDKLNERGVLTDEDEAEINRLSSTEERMRVAYAHIENAFEEKYYRVMDAMLHPEEVAEEVRSRMTLDLNDSQVPMVSGTNPEGGS